MLCAFFLNRLYYDLFQSLGYDKGQHVLLLELQEDSILYERVDRGCRPVDRYGLRYGYGYDRDKRYSVGRH